mmetsp:Transcript_14526/g.21419  ORF Transcript_14526/g.21419 Transcript_14526/m.21419 type:complete len:937 (-) Transcript_14526:197-3007(-)
MRSEFTKMECSRSNNGKLDEIQERDSPKSTMKLHDNDAPRKMNQKLSTSTHRPSRKSWLDTLGYTVRTLLLDAPLMIFFGLLVVTILIHEVGVKYYIPQLRLMRWNNKRKSKELTYYNRACEREDITTDDADDLMITEDMDAESCMKHMLKHGVSLYPNLISNETAKAAREFILERNVIEKGFFVIENENRYSFGIDVNSHPSIRQALKEISENKLLQAALTKIVGPNPAIVEFTGITALYGAADQFIHQDVLPKGSAFKFARNFVPTYSLFISLQDTTPEMGATVVCPGTHQCISAPISAICQEGGGIHVSGRSYWKSGTGALLNQQVFHRGAAHVDPQGPDRVLFILTFASRPRFGRNQVETRMIGQGGSYSLKWNQWGHTLQDFADPAKYMSQPWKTLRALGLYKPKGRDWGWDYVTVSSMRIANSDVGFGLHNLKEFATTGFTFIPDFLTPKLEEGYGWEKHLLETVIAVRTWLWENVTRVHLGYSLIMVLANLILYLCGYKKRGRAFMQCTGRLIFTHGLVVLIAVAIWYRVETSQWASNIKIGIAFKSLRSYTTTKQPGTIPLKTDVLISARFQSLSLASYRHILDVNHPGNRQWINLIESNCLNYNNLPISSKVAVANMVVFETKTSNMGRLLKQTDDSKWVVMSEKESRDQAHLSLLKRSDKTLHTVLTLLEHFLAELDVGVFRETAMHKYHIFDLLENLQDRIIGLVPEVPPGQPAKVSVNSMMKVQRFVNLPSTHATIDVRSIPGTMPEQLEPMAPYPAAWVQEEDIVDGQYRGSFNEWYRAVVTKMDANKGKINIKYFDGDKDNNLSHRSVRPYKALQMGEVVSVQVEGKYYPGRIVSLSGDDKYDIQTFDKGLSKNVPGYLVMRSYDNSESVVEGSVVEAKFQGREWFRGRIARINDDGTYDIDYDDGDQEFSVSPELVRLADD